MKRMGALIALLIIPFFFTSTSLAKSISSKLHSVSVPFIKNQGQLPEQVAFYANTFGGTVFVTKEGKLVYSLPADEGKGWVIREEFPDAVNVKVKGKERAKTKINIFKGDKRIRNVPSFKVVSVGEVAEGVFLDLKAYGNNVEKLFYVKPGADPEDIVVKVEGGKGLEVTEEGELVVKTDYGDIRFTKPVAYQEVEGKRKYVEVSYALLDENTYGFRVGKYDRSRTLVIDPLLAGTYLGGSARDVTSNPPPYFYFDIAVDQNDNIYVTGTTFSSDFPTTTGAYQTTYGGSDGFWNGDGFIVKFDPNLSQLLAATYLGGSGREYVSAIEIFNNYVYVAGTKTSTDFLMNPNVILGDPTILGFHGFTSFVLKMDTNLSNILASLLFGYRTHIQELKLDQAGNIYITGLFNNGNIPITPGAPQNTFAGGVWDVYVAKISADFSTLLGSTLLGGSSDEHVTGMDIDSQGNVYISGFTRSSDFPVTPGTADITFAGNNEGFVAKIHSDFLGWTITFLGGNGHEYVYDIKLDSSGNIYVVGKTFSQDFPVTQNAYQTTIKGGEEGFVTKLSNNLQTILASTFIGGSRSDWITTLTIDNSGNIVVAGGVLSADYPTTQNAYQTYARGVNPYSSKFESVISKFDPNLQNLLVSTYYGGKLGFGSEGIWAIAVDSSNNIIVYGLTNSEDLPTTQGAFSNQYAGGIDMFVAKFDPQLSNTPPQVNSFTADVTSGIEPLTVTFSWNVSDGAGDPPDPLTCTLDPGDGSNPYTINDCVNNTSLTHTYNTQGTYNAVLTVTDKNGASASQAIAIVVSAPTNNPPVINTFSANPNTGTAPLTVTFSWNVSDPDGDTLTCTLDINNDGTADYTINDCANNTSQTHTYNTVGTYTAVLTVDDGKGGQSNAQVNITVNAPPPSNNPPTINSFSANPDTGTAPLTVTFSWNVSDPDGDVLTCQLDVNNDGTADYTINDCANNTQQQHTYSKSGSYTAVLTVDDGNGGIANQNIQITVTAPSPTSNSSPVISKFNANPDKGSVPLTVTFGWDVSDPDKDPLTCTLDPGDGSTPYTINNCATNTQQKHIYNNAGTYTATLTVDDGKGASVSDSVVVNVAGGGEETSSGGCSTSGGGLMHLIPLLLAILIRRIVR